MSTYKVEDRIHYKISISLGLASGFLCGNSVDNLTTQRLSGFQCAFVRARDGNPSIRIHIILGASQKRSELNQNQCKFMHSSCFEIQYERRKESPVANPTEHSFAFAAPTIKRLKTE